MGFNIATSWVSDLDDAALDVLLASGEYLYVDRKEAEPRMGFAPTIAAFANSHGGWLLIGVADKNRPDGQPDIKGWVPPGKQVSDASAWLANKVRDVIEPAPTFGTRVLSRDGDEVLVVRVLASAVTPHFVRSIDPDGQAHSDVYVRFYEQKTRNWHDRPVDSHGELQALVARGFAGEDRARQKVEDPLALPLVTAELLLPAGVEFTGTAGFGSGGIDQRFVAQPRRPSIAIRCVPVDPPPWLAERILCEEGLVQARRALAGFASTVWAPDIKPDYGYHTTPSVRPRGYAVRATASLPQGRAFDQRFGHDIHATMVVDAGGAVGISVVINDDNNGARNGERDLVDLEFLAARWLEPMTTAVAELTAGYGVLGRCLLDLRAAHFDDIDLVGLDGGTSAALLSGRLQMGGSMTLPAASTEQVAELTDAWRAEWSRTAGIAAWPGADRDVDSE